MSDFGTNSSVALSTLAVGDIIFASVIIEKVDMADSKATSGTAKKIRKGEPVDRFCVVLATETGSVTVTYLATFAGSKTLPPTLEKEYWYPVAPATKESTYDPLTAINTKPQWVALRKAQKVSTSSVLKYSVKVSSASAAKLLESMKS